MISKGLILRLQMGTGVYYISTLFILLVLKYLIFSPSSIEGVYLKTEVKRVSDNQIRLYDYDDLFLLKPSETISLYRERDPEKLVHLFGKVLGKKGYNHDEFFKKLENMVFGDDLLVYKGKWDGLDVHILFEKDFKGFWRIYSRTGTSFRFKRRSDKITSPIFDLGLF